MGTMSQPSEEIQETVGNENDRTTFFLVEAATSYPDGFRIFTETTLGRKNRQAHLLTEAKFGPEVTRVSRRADNHSSHHVEWDKLRNVVTYTRKSEPGIEQREPVREPTRELKPETNARISLRSDLPKPRRAAGPPTGFESSPPINSHGGGRHTMLSSREGSRNFPQEYVEPKSGNTYRKTSYQTLNGDTLYVER